MCNAVLMGCKVCTRKLSPWRCTEGLAFHNTNNIFTQDPVSKDSSDYAHSGARDSYQGIDLAKHFKIGRSRKAWPNKCLHRNYFIINMSYQWILDHKKNRTKNCPSYNVSYSGDSISKNVE